MVSSVIIIFHLLINTLLDTVVFNNYFTECCLEFVTYSQELYTIHVCFIAFCDCWYIYVRKTLQMEVV